MKTFQTRGKLQKIVELCQLADQQMNHLLFFLLTNTQI